MAPCLSIRPPPGVQPSPHLPFQRVSIFPQSPALVQNRAKRTMGLRARVAFFSTPSAPATLPPAPRAPTAPTPARRPAQAVRPAPLRPTPARLDLRALRARAPAPRPGGPTPAAPGAQLRDTQSPAPPPRPPRSPLPNKSRFLSPQQIKDQEGVKNSFSGPGGGGAREKPGLWGLFDGKCVGNPEECGYSDRRGGERRREEGPPPGTPAARAPQIAARLPSRSLCAPSYSSPSRPCSFDLSLKF